MSLNKFERARLISTRSDELANGAQPKVDVKDDEGILSIEYSKIAERELEAGVLELEIYTKN